ncbi:hypothetical protein NP493_73g00034 [Ridgeia piscesae]|uniref:Galactosyltransferase C-terminal domain-containing protein n=1 Tax=Ridgeia piscesae TaxID=27915 RepID=A0AAD9UIL2_RIDPI|nr:hypothetical protein NP493_73g00034 [Ridgeia piscesae]
MMLGGCETNATVPRLYVWVKVPDHVEKAALTEGRPFWSTTLVGCAIAINRTYFLHIGGFDTDQKIWGGENLELAFRAWLCGGAVVTVPCSRVGHLFRPLPYSNGSGWQQQWQKNLMRVADLWLGDYRRYFYSSTLIYPGRKTAYTADEKTSLAARFELKKRLQCRNFDWLLSNVAPEVPIPPHDALYHGEIINYRTHACWVVLPDGYLAITFACYEHKLIVDNIFSLNGDGLLMYKDKCVRFMFPLPNLKVERCPQKPTLEYGIWSVSYVDKRWAQIQVTHRHNDKITVYCVMHVTSAVEPHRRMQMPQTAPCVNDNPFQLWAFTYRFDYTYKV